MKKAVKLLSLTLVMGMLHESISAGFWDQIDNIGNRAGAVVNKFGNSSSTTTTDIDMAKKNRVANEASSLDAELSKAKQLVQPQSNEYNTFDYAQSRVRKLISLLDTLTTADFSSVTSIINGIATSLTNTSRTLVDTTNDLVSAAHLLIPEGQFHTATFDATAATVSTTTTTPAAAAAAATTTRSRSARGR
ncbi:MAG: hypothetical protein LBF44_03740 [Holosporaceae bacterium]|jgi:hypothetical protein|nr:hypothetical protein [Holosporaceae bacterium]